MSVPADCNTGVRCTGKERTAHSVRDNRLGQLSTESPLGKVQRRELRSLTSGMEKMKAHSLADLVEMAVRLPPRLPEIHGASRNKLIESLS